MSYHKIKDHIEDTMVFVNDLQGSSEEKRSMYYNLFAFQNLFDSSFTHFKANRHLVKEQFHLSCPDRHAPNQDNVNILVYGPIE